MKLINEQFIQLNIKEKQIILSQIQNKDQKIFYTKLFKQEQIPFIFIYDLINIIDKSSKIFSDLKSLINLGSRISISINKKCLNKMRDFQKKSIKQIEELLSTQAYIKGFMIFDEPGLGKTLTSICVMKGYYNTFDINLSKVPLVVVVPKTLIKQWINSLNKYFPNNSITTNPEIKSDIYVINFEKIEKFSDLHFDGCNVIIDEAHLLHNIESERYKLIFYFLKYKSSFSLLLTGTPIRESIIDLFSLYALISQNILDIDLLIKVKNFLSQYKYTGKFILSLIESCYIRNTKSQIFDDVGNIIMKPLLIKVDDFKFRKNKLGLDQIDSRFKDNINIIKKYRELIDTDPKIKIIDEILHQVEYSQLKTILKRYPINPEYSKIILEYFNLIYVKSKQSLKSKIWQELLDNTLEYIILNHLDNIKIIHKKYKKILVVTKSRKIIDLYLQRMSQIGINGLTIESSDSYNQRFEKIKMFETKQNINFLISTYPIIEAGLDMPFIDNIFILDFPFRPHSLIQIINRKQRLNNIDENIFITFLKISYKHNIIDHHRIILFEIYQNVKKILRILDEKD